MSNLSALVGLAVAAVLFLAAAAVFSPLLRVRLRWALAPASAAVIALIVMASYLDHS